VVTSMVSCELFVRRNHPSRVPHTEPLISKRTKG
jgi:hypothetical protein